MGRTLKIKSFRQFILEGEPDIKTDTMLRTDIIKNLNAEFYDISPKDQGQQTADIKELFGKIQVVLDGYGITMVGDDGKQFAGNVITNKNQANVLIAPKASTNGDYNAYDNAVLDVKWNTFDGEYALKSVSVKERK
jgi:hypothetical protein